MRSTMTRVVLIGVATSAMAVGLAPAASAAGGDTIHGGCFFDTDQQAVVTNGAYTGVIGDKSLTQDASGLPADATVSCQIQVNGFPAPGTTFSYSGAGAQAGVDRVSYAAAGTDWVALCQRVVYSDGTDTGWGCLSPCECQLPPQVIIDLLNSTFAVLDAQVCPVLVAAAGTYGPVTITPDGDVYVADPIGLGLNPLYDCPPYGNY